ncbi:hypothetical protein [Flavobacterium sp. C4GT6]|uniref:hypothetical protein n=1 Tax=Flavobacterium sp. C4GT6 TaxID=3103818 RepID=UPI002ED1AB32
MANLLNQNEFEVNLKWQDFKKYYVAIFLLTMALTPLIFLIRWLTDVSETLRDLLIYITVFIIFASLVVFPVFMFRRSKRAPLLNSKLIAKSLAILVTCWFVAGVSSLKLTSIIINIQKYESANLDLYDIPSDLFGLAIALIVIQAIAFLVLFPISFLLNKYFPWELPYKTKKEAK